MSISYNNDKLPSELLYKIFSILETPILFQTIPLVCSSWRQVCLNNCFNFCMIFMFIQKYSPNKLNNLRIMNSLSLFGKFFPKTNNLSIMSGNEYTSNSFSLYLSMFITNFKQLKTIKIFSSYNLDFSAVLNLKYCRNLEVFDVSYPNFNDACLSHLIIPSLKSITITNKNNLTKEGICYFLKNNKQLQKILLNNFNKSAYTFRFNNIFNILYEYTEDLHYLDFSYNNKQGYTWDYTNYNIKQLEILFIKHKNLKVIKFNNSNFGDDILEIITANNNVLEEAHFKNSKKMTLIGIENFVKYNKNLKVINFSNINTKITNSKFMKDLKKSEKIKTLSLNDY